MDLLSLRNDLDGGEMKPHCQKCGRVLTDSFSIAVGMGPECRGGMRKKGWKFPKPKYRVTNGRLEYLGMVGKVVPPAPTGDLTKSPKARKVKGSEVKDENDSD